MARITRDEALNSDDRVYDEVHVDEWKPGATIRIRNLSAEEYDLYQQATIDRSDLDNKKPNIVGASVMLVSMGCLDDEGAQLFRPQDVVQLRKRHSGVIERVANAIASLSGIDRATVEETEKNSPAAMPPSSDTGSHLHSESQTSEE